MLTISINNNLKKIKNKTYFEVKSFPAASQEGLKKITAKLP
jgi:hypothetical protein